MTEPVALRVLTRVDKITPPDLFKPTVRYNAK